jgi:hypothetical protein
MIRLLIYSGANVTAENADKKVVVATFLFWKCRKLFHVHSTFVGSSRYGTKIVSAIENPLVQVRIPPEVIGCIAPLLLLNSLAYRFLYDCTYQKRAAEAEKKLGKNKNMMKMWAKMIT